MTYCHDCNKEADGYRCDTCLKAWLSKGDNRHVHGAGEEYNRKRVPSGGADRRGWILAACGVVGVYEEG